jgi:hypothetical protein
MRRLALVVIIGFCATVAHAGSFRGVFGDASPGNISGGGNVAGGGSSVDKALVRWSGTGGTQIDSSNITCSDTDDLSGVASLTLSATAPYMSFLDTAGGNNTDAKWLMDGGTMSLLYDTDSNGVYESTVLQATSSGVTLSGDLAVNGGDITSDGLTLTIASQDAIALSNGIIATTLKQNVGELEVDKSIFVTDEQSNVVYLSAQNISFAPGAAAALLLETAPEDGDVYALFRRTGNPGWVFGMDASDSNAFAWSYSASPALGASNKMTLDTDGNATLAGSLAVGSLTAAASGLSVAQSDTSTTPNVSITQASTGDAAMAFVLTGGASYALGIDNSAGDAFKLSYNASGTPALGSGDIVSITNEGFVSSGGLDATWSTAGEYAQIGATNLDNTDPASHAALLLKSGGANGGDAFGAYSIDSVGGWAVGVNNDESDAFHWNWVASPGAVVLDNAATMSLGTSGQLSVSGDFITEGNVSLNGGWLALTNANAPGTVQTTLSDSGGGDDVQWLLNGSTFALAADTDDDATFEQALMSFNTANGNATLAGTLDVNGDTVRTDGGMTLKNASGSFVVEGTGAVNTVAQMTSAGSGATTGFYLRAGGTGGTIAAPQIVTNGQRVAEINAIGYDGAGFQNLAAIRFNVDAAPGSGDMPGSIRFFTTPDGSATLGERMTITNASLVGINQSAPSYTLDVLGANAAGAYRVAKFRSNSASTDDSTAIVLANDESTEQSWEFTIGGDNNGLGLTDGELYLYQRPDNFHAQTVWRDGDVAMAGGLRVGSATNRQATTGRISATESIFAGTANNNGFWLGLADAGFYHNETDPLLQFDTSDYFYFSRSLSRLAWTVADDPKFIVHTAGTDGDPQQGVSIQDVGSGYPFGGAYSNLTISGDGGNSLTFHEATRGTNLKCRATLPPAFPRTHCAIRGPSAPTTTSVHAHRRRATSIASPTSPTRNSVSCGRCVLSLTRC